MKRFQKSEPPPPSECAEFMAVELTSHWLIMVNLITQYNHDNNNLKFS